MKENVEDVTPISEENGNKPVQRYNELPGLLVSKVGKNEMFDIQKFLDSAKSEKTVEQYLNERGNVVALYAKLLETDKKYLILNIEGEPPMMHAALALDFAGWVIPELNIYMLERMHELLIDGFSVSDRYLGAASQRLPKQEPQQNG